jgi:hypothetical protein
MITHVTRALTVGVGTVVIGGSVSTLAIPMLPILAGVGIICGTVLGVKYMTTPSASAQKLKKLEK